MALLSPGVEIKEIDASTIVPTISDSVGLFCGEFVKGPINDRILITNPDDLIDIFGEPTDDNYNQFYQAWNFLQYQNTLFIVRVQNETKQKSQVLNCTVPEGCIESQGDFEKKYDTISTSGDGATLAFISQTPGEWGNGIEIYVQDEDDFGGNTVLFDGVLLDDLFQFSPNQDSGEFAVLIKYGDEIEAFIVNTDKDAKDDNGRASYVETVINRQSNFVYVKAFGDLDANDISDADELAGGALGSGTAKLEDAYELFDNPEEIDVDIIIGNELDTGLSQVNLAKARKDCIAFIGSPEEVTTHKKAVDAVKDVVKWREGGTSVNGKTFNENTDFACLAGNYKYQYDRYNDKNRWINLQGDIQGLRAQTNTTNASWWASAGLERGQILNVLKLQYVPNAPQRDQLYKKGINPVTSFPGLGTVMWGLVQ